MNLPKTLKPFTAQPSVLGACLYALLLASPEVQSHGLMHETGNLVSTTASMNFRESAVVPEDSAWTLPGFFLGGEAVPAQKRFGLDEATLAFAWEPNRESSQKTSQKPGIQSSATPKVPLRLYGEIGVHGQHSELQLQELWAAFDLAGISIHAGKMSSIARREYDRSGPFSERPLLEDVFFGGHQHNLGVRLYAKPNEALSIGLEGFSGDTWPSNHSITTVFSELTLDCVIQTRLGAWYRYGQAQNRQDERYEGDHHGGVTLTNADYGFTGDVKQAGLYGIATLKGDVNYELGVETIHSEHKGTLTNGESANIASTDKGLRLFSSAQLAKVTLAAQFEQLSADTHFIGGSSLFLQNSLMINQGYEPQRTTLSLLYALTSDLKVRLEASEDNLGDDTQARFVVGLTWQNLQRL